MACTEPGEAQHTSVGLSQPWSSAFCSTSCGSFCSYAWNTCSNTCGRPRLHKSKALQLLWKLRTSTAAHPSCGLLLGVVRQTRIHQVRELDMSQVCGVSSEAR